MAAIFILAGGLFGFASAIVSLVVLDSSLLMALAIWSGFGLAAVVLGIAMSLLVQRAAANPANSASPRPHSA
jgi:hypothetical protein